MYDSNNTKVASWKSGSETMAVCENGVEQVTKSSKSNYSIDYESLLGKSIKGVRNVRYYRTEDSSLWELLSTQTPEAEVKSQNGTLRFNGEYSYAFGTRSTSGSWGGDKIKISNQNTYYVKKKIYLAKEFPNNFTEKGWMILSESNEKELGVEALPRGMNLLPSSGDYLYGDFCVINNLYEENNSIIVRTPRLDENGITLKGLTADKYKLVQTGCDATHEKASVQYINVHD